MIPIYSPKNNSIHSIPLGSKCIYAGGALVSVMIINHPVILAAGLLSIAMVFWRAGEIMNWLWYLKVFLVLGVVYFAISVLVSQQGETTLYEALMQNSYFHEESWLPFLNQFLKRVTGNVNPIVIDEGIFSIITIEEVVFGISFVLKLLLSLSIFILFSLTVHPDNLLRRLGRRAVRSALALSIAVRLFPTLIKDANDIYEAYVSRGIPLDQRNSFLRCIRRIPLMIPLLANSLERTNTLAESMECRGFGRQLGPTTVLKKRKSGHFFRSIEFSSLSMVTIILPCIFLLLLLTQLGGWGMKSSYTVDMGVGSNEAVLGILLILMMGAPMVSSVLGGGGN
jgi:energy-coupling factor transporter transmembrane protein EcfT